MFLGQAIYVLGPLQVGVTQGGGVDARRTPLDGRVPDVSVQTMCSLLEELLRPNC
jgi:hypothetical protein